MQLSQSTIATLKNFATINTTIVIDPGKTISTMTVDKTIIAVAELDDEFEQQFAVYDLPRFISILSIFQNPTIVFGNNKQAKIKEGNRIVNYTFAEPSILTKAPKGLKELTEIASFELTSETLSALQKAVAVMGLDRVRIKGDGEKLYVGGLDSQSATSDTYSVEVGETNQEFDAYIKVEYLKVIPGAYNVSVSNRMVKLTALERTLNYWIAVEMNSKV